jgi:Mg-chelatase subunit ChlD
MTDSSRRLPTQASADRAVEDFIKGLKNAPVVRPVGRRGRLLFALDATMSREPTWDTARKIQAEMFHEAGLVGGLSIQLVCFRGLDQFQASPWLSDAQTLADAMAEVECRGGKTQLCKVLDHALSEAARERIDAIVYIGDCFEERADTATNLAGKIALYGIPIFVFHEGRNPLAAGVFKDLARITRGAYCPFDNGSAKQLAELLRAVAVYAAGGAKALADHASREGGAALMIAHQVASR